MIRQVVNKPAVCLGYINHFIWRKTNTERTQNVNKICRRHDVLFPDLRNELCDYYIVSVTNGDDVQNS